MRIDRLVLAVIALLATTLVAEVGCLSRQATAAKGKHMSLNLTIASVGIGEDLFTVTYTAINSSDAAIYLFTGVSADPSRLGREAYRHLDGDVLVISQEFLAVPDNLEVIAPFIPLATQLAPGETQKATITIELPVTRNMQYPRPNRSGERQARHVTHVKKIRLRMGFVANGGLKAAEKGTVEGNRFFRVSPAEKAFADQQFAETDEMELSQDIVFLRE